MGAAIQFGAATEEQFDEWREVLERWRNLPGAFSAIPWGEAIGHRP